MKALVHVVKRATNPERARAPSRVVWPSAKTAFAPAIQCKCACGVGCPRCYNDAAVGSHTPIQARLTVSQPGDEYEREADRVADTVMRMPDLQLQDGTEEEEVEEVGPEETPVIAPSLAQRRVERVTEGAKVWAVESQTQQLKGRGEPLPSSERSFFEPRFGRDFGQVRIHRDADAARLARTLNARAFTVGSELVFAENQFRPQTSEGRTLIAHELAHVIQQAAWPGGLVARKKRGHRERTSVPDDEKMHQILREFAYVMRIRVGKRYKLSTEAGPVLAALRNKQSPGRGFWLIDGVGPAMYVRFHW